jgi:hypothetical protein
MNFKLWLIEAEYKDVRNTYKDLMDYLEKTPDDVFVNFSDRPKDLFVPSKKTSHYDPMGIYGFPKEYMQQKDNKNQGFWSLPYITVFKMKPDAKVLDLSTITVDAAKQMLQKMGIEDYIDKPYHRKPVDASGGALLWNTMEKYIALNRLHKNTAWNALFKKIGVDAVRDTKSIIHSNEPNQVVVLNPSKAEIVKSVEKPLNTFQQKIQKQMYDLLNELGNKYLKDFKITSTRRGSADITKNYPNYELAAKPDISMLATSINPELPLTIELHYSAYNGKLTGYINRKAPLENLFRTEIKPDRLSSDQINVVDVDFPNMKTQMTEALDKITQEFAPSQMGKTKNIHQSIIDQLNFANFKTKYENGDYKSIAQFKTGNFPAALKVITSPTENGVNTNLNLSYVARDTYQGKNRRYKIPFESITINSDDDVKDVKAKFKTKINTMIDNIRNNELSYMYDNDLHALKNLEKLL